MAETFQINCPSCQSTNTQDRKLVYGWGGVAIAVVSILSITILIPIIFLFVGLGASLYGFLLSDEKRYKCKNCHELFGEPQANENKS